MALGATPTVDRAYLMRLAPPRHLGHYLGLYAMVGRFAVVVGPLLCALTVDGLGFGRPVAVATLLILVGVAAVVLAPIDDGRRAWPAADLAPMADHSAEDGRLVLGHAAG